MQYIFKVFIVLSVLAMNLSLVEAKSESTDDLLLFQKSLTIMGEAVVTQEEVVNFIKKSNPNPKLNCSIEELVELYYIEAARENIRPDVALSQALLETGFFRYGGDVKPYQNNFCGLGSVGGGEKGATFLTPQLGVRAHIQHLLVYADKRKPSTPIVDPRYEMVKKRPDIYGVCKTWYDLDGRWAAKGVPYGARILNIHERILKSVPKKDLQQILKDGANDSKGSKPPEKTKEEVKKDKKSKSKGKKK